MDDLCLWFAYNTFPSISHLLLSFIRDSLAFSHNSYSYPLILLVLDTCSFGSPKRLARCVGSQCTNLRQSRSRGNKYS